MLKSKSFNQQRKGRQPIELSFILESQGSDTFIHVHVTSPSNTEEYYLLQFLVCISHISKYSLSSK